MRNKTASGVGACGAVKANLARPAHVCYRPRNLALLVALLILGVLAFGEPKLMAETLAGVRSAESAFQVRNIRITTDTRIIPLRVELAATAQQRARGLMERTRLPPDAGMLFMYSDIQPSTSGFWMFRTRIPLDIAFLDTTGRIMTIQSMTPCASSYPALCPVYWSRVNYSAALEVNRGYFKRNAISVGDHVRLPVLPR